MGHRGAGMLAVLALSASVAMAAAPVSERDYRLSMESTIKGKGYKFYVTVEPVKASAALVYTIKPASDQLEVALKSMHYTWVTSGVNVKRDATPDKVVDVDNGRAQTVWTPGQTKPGDTNPLEAFGKPVGFLTPGGREPGAIVRSPEKYVKFTENFRLGHAPLWHRPALPAGELKAGQQFTADSRMPDPTYSGVQWTVPVEWTVEGISGTGDDAVLQLSGAAAATEEKMASLFGRLVEGTLSFTSSVKMKLKTADLISAESRLSVRWKRDPADSNSGMLEDSAEALIRETALESK